MLTLSDIFRFWRPDINLPMTLSTFCKAVSSWKNSVQMFFYVATESTCMHTPTHTHTYAQMFLYTYMHAHTQTQKQTSPHMYMFMHMKTHAYTCVYIYKCTHTHSHTFICICKHTHTHIQTSCFLQKWYLTASNRVIHWPKGEETAALRQLFTW